VNKLKLTWSSLGLLFEIIDLSYEEEEEEEGKYTVNKRILDHRRNANQICVMVTGSVIYLKRKSFIRKTQILRGSGKKPKKERKGKKKANSSFDSD